MAKVTWGFGATFCGTLMPSTVSYFAQNVRREVGMWFDDENAKAGCKVALRNGYRVVKIELKY